MHCKNRMCWHCKTQENLTRHHVNGGKGYHQENNPYQKEWEKLGIKTVMLCKRCHKLLHSQLLFREKED